MPRARRQPQPVADPMPAETMFPLSELDRMLAAVRHGPAHCRRKREGATQFPTIGLFERNANNFKGTRNTKAQKSWSSRAEPEVRIHLPPAESHTNLIIATDPRWSGRRVPAASRLLGHGRRDISGHDVAGGA